MLLRQSPLCQVGCATLPEDITSPVSRQASSTGLQEAFTSHATLDRSGRLDFVYKLPEAFTRPTGFGWPCRLDFLRLCLSSL